MVDADFAWLKLKVHEPYNPPVQCLLSNNMVVHTDTEKVKSATKICSYP